jgi:hypothetical protein
LIRLLELLEHEQARVVHYDVEPSEAFEHTLDELATGPVVTEILVTRKSVYLARDRICVRAVASAAVQLQPGIVHDHVRAGRGKRARVRRTKPTTRTSDKHDLPVKPQRFLVGHRHQGALAKPAFWRLRLIHCSSAGAMTSFIRA